MTKSITNFLIIFFIFQQLKYQISKIYQNGFNSFCDETLQMISPYYYTLCFIMAMVENTTGNGEFARFAKWKVGVQVVRKLYHFEKYLVYILITVFFFTNVFIHIQQDSTFCITVGHKQNSSRVNKDEVSTTLQIIQA